MGYSGKRVSKVGKGKKIVRGEQTNNRNDKTDKRVRLIRLAIVCVVLLGVVAIVAIVSDYARNKEDKQGEDWAAKWAVEDSKNYEGIYVHGGNYKTFNELNSVVRAYWDCYEERDLYSMYNNYYANHALGVYGYAYPYEDYVSELELMADMYHIYRTDKDYVDVSYKAVTYQDYTNYYLFTFNLQFTYRTSLGDIVSSPVMENIYTVIPYRDKKGNVYYRLLDFNISDIGVVADRFKKIEKED